MSSESSTSDLSSDWDIVASYTSSNENKESDSSEVMDSTSEIQDATIKIQDSTIEILDNTTELQDTTEIQSTTEIQGTTPEIQDTTPEIQDTTPEIQDTIPKIQNDTTEVQDKISKLQNHATDVEDNTMETKDIEEESNNIKVEVISARDEEFEVSSQHSDCSSCSDIEVIDEITDININEPVLVMSVPQAMFASEDYIHTRISELPHDELTSEELQETPVLPSVIPDLSQDIPEISQEIPELPQDKSELSQNKPKLPQDISELPQNIPELSQDKPELPQDKPELLQEKPELSQKIQDLPATQEVIRIQPLNEVESPRPTAVVADRGFFSMIEENYSHSMLKNILKVVFVIITSICLWNHLHQSTVGKDDLKRMLEHMKHLTDTFREENAELREQLLSEMQNKNLYSSLETQITQLKDENLKLNHMLQDMISDLQKPSRFAESDSLNNEMNKLKDQINVLRFENEELQKQVGKFRYSDRAPKSQHVDHSTGKIDVPKADLDKENDKKNEADENITSTSEMDKLHQELVIEIEKIKQWNIIIETITRELHKTTQKEKKKWSFKEVKQSLNNIVHEAQKNIMDTVGNFQKMNISDIFTKYIKYDDEGKETVLDSIKHYYEATKEKTFKIFKEDMHKDVVNNAWSTVDKVAKKWNRMKQYFGMTEGGINDDDTREPSQGKIKPFYKKDVNKHSFTDPQGKIVTEEAQNVHDKYSKEENWYFKKQPDAEKQHQPDSWLFGRAAYREKERNNDDSVNWYLKRKRYQRRNTYGDDYVDDDKYSTYD